MLIDKKRKVARVSLSDFYWNIVYWIFNIGYLISNKQ
jgi:hypothetical protein